VHVTQNGELDPLTQGLSSGDDDGTPRRQGETLRQPPGNRRVLPQCGPQQQRGEAHPSDGDRLTTQSEPSEQHIDEPGHGASGAPPRAGRHEQEKEDRRADGREDQEPVRHPGG
jgi:hypothetical protein